MSRSNYISEAGREVDAELFSEDHGAITISNGLASIDIGSIEVLDPAIFAQPLWLEVIVEGETLAPRQKLLGSPYAMTLVGGAVVGSAHAGDGSDGTDEDYGSLSVVNSSQGTALVIGTSGDGAMIRACDNVIDSRDCPDLVFQVGNGGEIYTAASTEISVSSIAMVASYQSNVTIFSSGSGNTSVRAGSVGAEYVYIPVDVPSVLLGTPQKLKSIEVCYDLEQAASLIDTTTVRVNDGNGSYTELIENITDRTSTSWECYTVTAATAQPITGSLFVRFVLDYAGTGVSHDITFGKITLTLEGEAP